MKRGKILVVDDNQGIRSALKILLPAHFAEVEIIASPKSQKGSLAIGPSSTASISTIERNTSPKTSRWSQNPSAGD